LRRRYFTLSIMGLILWMMTMGCDAALNKNWGPIIEVNHILGANCGGDWTTDVAGTIITGVESRIGIQYNTGRVTQVFEFDLSISSPTKTREVTPVVTGFTTQVLKLDSGKSSGTMRVLFDICTSCKGQGDYIFDVIVTDADGRSATYQGAFTQVDSPMYGDHPCKCKTQCGQCKPILSSHWIRCNCGCINVGEDCSDL